MDQILIADKDHHGAAIYELFLEYLNWVASRIYQEYGLTWSVEDTIKQDMLTLDKFMPPKGRLLLAIVEDSPQGMACLKELSGKTGEVKRMYVRPGLRGRGLGKALLKKLINEALGIGYTSLKLDSARFMIEAHHLYRALGFLEIEPYDGSEVPEEYRSHSIFMEKYLI